MSARTRTSKAADATVLAPMSATAAELLHRLQQEAADAVAPAPGTIVLAPHGAPCSHNSDDTSAYAYSNGYSACTRLYRHHGNPTPIWTGSEQRTDASGATWERRIRAVVDNFGDLVEVAA